MVKNTRVTYTKRNPYRTKSNTLKMVKTPGGRMAGHYRTKLAKGVRCGDCGTQLAGIKHMRPIAFKNVAKRQRTVARAYGGSRCANCVKSRVVRAFLIEEQKIVKKVMQEKKAAK